MKKKKKEKTLINFAQLRQFGVMNISTDNDNNTVLRFIINIIIIIGYSGLIM